jgi:hypothetical protein
MDEPEETGIVTEQEWNEWLHPRPRVGITQEQLADFISLTLPHYKRSPGPDDQDQAGSG